jgi:hypothetical protein
MRTSLRSLDLLVPSPSYFPNGAARPPVVFFTDAGCLVDPGCIAAHRRALCETDLSGGAVEAVLSSRRAPAEVVDAYRHLRQEHYVTSAGFAATCNLAVRRGVLDVVRFDPRRLFYSEDMDFCHRATDAGFTLRYTPNAVVQHPARRTARAVLRKARGVGRALATLPQRSRPPAPSPPRLTRELVRLARREQFTRGRIWELRVIWLEFRRVQVQRRAYLRTAKEAQSSRASTGS